MQLQKVTAQKQIGKEIAERVEKTYSPSIPALSLRETLETQASEFRSLGLKSFRYERAMRQAPSQAGMYTPASSRRLPAKKRLVVYGNYVYLEIEVPSRYIIEWDAYLGLSHSMQSIGTKRAGEAYAYRFYYVCTLAPKARVRELKAEDIHEAEELLYQPELVALLEDMMPNNCDSNYGLHDLIRDKAVPMKCYQKRDDRGLYKPAEQLEKEQSWGNKPKKRKFKAC